MYKKYRSLCVSTLRLGILKASCTSILTYSELYDAFSTKQIEKKPINSHGLISYFHKEIKQKLENFQQFLWLYIIFWRNWKIQGLTTRNQCFPCHTLSSWQGNFQRHEASCFYLVATGKWMKETTNEDRGGRIGQGRADGKSKRGSDLPNYIFYFPSRRISVQKSTLALWTLKKLEQGLWLPYPTRRWRESSPAAPTLI